MSATPIIKLSAPLWLRGAALPCVIVTGFGGVVASVIVTGFGGVVTSVIAIYVLLWATKTY